MQSSYYKRPSSPTRASIINPLSYDLANINFDGIGSGITDKITKLSNLLKTRGTLPKPIAMNNDYEGDGSVVKYTREQFNDLYKTNARRSSSEESGGDGYFDKLFFMFQLYIAFINALMNATKMSASMIFGNQSLQNVFSIFLVNVLNMILKTNVSELTPEQLRDLLEKNRPILQQISRILIDEASQLLVGLSEVCSKIAMDWVQNVLPGLVKSAAVGIPSAVEAAIPPLGELVEIINTGMALMASFMKIVGGVQRNVDNVSQGLSHVQNAYTSLEKIKQLLSQPPSEIVKTATSAVITPALNNAAQSFLQNVVQPQPLSSPPLLGPLSPQTETQSTSSSSTVPAPASPSQMRNLFNIGKNMVQDAARGVAREGLNRAANVVSQFLTTPSGTALTDTTGTPVTTSFWNRSWKRLFDMAVNKLKQSKEAMEKIRLNSGIGENGKPLASSIIVDYILKHPDILIPYLPAPYNIGAIAFRLVQTYMQRVREQKASTTSSGGGLNRVKSRKYLKNPKQFNRYISNLRKKTAKKELELVNSIQELKSI